MTDVDDAQQGAAVSGARSGRAATEKPRTRRRKSLSDKQRAILEVIQRSVSQRGYPPSMREIGDAVGLASLSSVAHQLGQLELSGYLRRDPNRPRALEVLIDLPESTGRAEATTDFETSIPVGDATMVPMVGRIAAGVPITAEQQVEEVFPLPRQLVGNGELFMLKFTWSHGFVPLRLHWLHRTEPLPLSTVTRPSSAIVTTSFDPLPSTSATAGDAIDRPPSWTGQPGSGLRFRS